MKKSFRCGRLKILKDGKTKPMKINEGGGVRNCQWESIDMNLHETHQALKHLFGLDEKENKSVLFDFQQQPLDKNQYRTFLQYTQHHGLTFNNTLVYLGTPDLNDIGESIPRPSRAAPIVLPRSSIPNPTRVEADSSTSTTTLIKIDDEPTFVTVKRDRRSFSSTSYSRYSFDHSLNDLVQHLRNMIVENPREENFLKLFEDICTLRGLASIVLDRLKQDMESGKVNPQTLYTETLEKIANLSRTIKSSIDLNKTKIRQYPILTDTFSQFDEHFKTLRHRWENHSPPAKESSRATARTSGRKEAAALTSLTHVLTPQAKVKFLLPLKNELEDFLTVVDHHSSSSFYHTVRLMIKEVKSCTKRTSLKQKLYSVERRLSHKMNEQHRRKSPYSVHRDLQQAFNRLLDVIRHLLDSAENLQSEKRRNFASSSTNSAPAPSTPTSTTTTTKTTTTTPTPTRKIFKKEEDDEQDDDEDDKSSEASHSSFGDEVLMEVARTAYEHRPKR